MNKTDKAKTWEIAFKITRKYNMDLFNFYNEKRNIDTYSFTRNNPTIKRLKVEVDEGCMNFEVCKFDAISNTKKYLHSVCKIDDIKNIHISNIYARSDNWENFVDNLMYHLDFYKLNK